MCSLQPPEQRQLPYPGHNGHSGGAIINVIGSPCPTVHVSGAPALCIRYLFHAPSNSPHSALLNAQVLLCMTQLMWRSCIPSPQFAEDCPPCLACLVSPKTSLAHAALRCCPWRTHLGVTRLRVASCVNVKTGVGWTPTVTGRWIGGARRKTMTPMRNSLAQPLSGESRTAPYCWQ